MLRGENLKEVVVVVVVVVVAWMSGRNDNGNENKDGGETKKDGFGQLK